MPLILPAPANDRETTAQRFIATMDLRTPFIPGRNFALYMRTAFQLLKETETTPEVFACVGLLIAQYLPIIGPGPQWSFIVPFVCPPAPPITDNIIFCSFHYHNLLNSLHVLATQVKPPTRESFDIQAKANLLPISRLDVVPQPPNTLNNILPLRAGYAALIERYYP